MPDAVQHVAYRYSAFISYSHRDSTFARRLHRKLETYRLPHRLRRNDPLGLTASGRLKPVFRDRDELRATADLSAAVREAIAASSHMIVICSANVVRSDWVRREVALFREMHGDHAILAALTEDTPPDAAPTILDAVFPPGDGAPQPLAADFSRHGDGSRLALLKLVAALAGVRLDELVQRDAHRRIRQATQLGFAAVVAMAVMAVLTVVAVNARATAEAERTRGEKLTDSLLTNLRSELKSRGNLELLAIVNNALRNYFFDQDITQSTDTELEQRAKLLQAAGEDDSARGKFDLALAEFEQAERTRAALLKAQPNDFERIFDYSQSQYYLGDINWQLNNVTRAQAGFEAYATLTRRLVQKAPDNPRWQEEAADAEVDLGMFVLRQWLDLEGAQRHFAAALFNFGAVAHKQPTDSEIQLGLVNVHGYLADVARLRGDYAAALAERVEAAVILTGMLQHGQLNKHIRRALIANALGFSRIDISSGATNEAMDRLKEGYHLALDLAREDLTNNKVAKQVRIFELFQAAVWLMLPAGGRPSNSEVVTKIGKCNEDLERRHSQELASFCFDQNAKYLAEIGDMADARDSLAKGLVAAQSQHGKLSETWGMDLYYENAAAKAYVEKREKLE